MSSTISDTGYLARPTVEQASALFRGDVGAALKAIGRIGRSLATSRSGPSIASDQVGKRAESSGLTAAPTLISTDQLIWNDILTESALISRAAIAAEVRSSDAAIPRREMMAGIVDVADLLAKLDGSAPSAELPTHRVAGAFFPSILLYEGWWNKAKTGAAAWGTDATGDRPRNQFQNIQSWLNRGFEQWGPSWNLSASDQSDADLLAQLGYGDEANSIPVVVGPRRAQRARDALSKCLVVRAEVRGALCHRDLVATQFTGRSQAIAAQLVTANPQYQHFLLVKDDNPDHGIEPDRSKLDLYSAYLWQCLVRKEDEERARTGTLRLSEAIFLWEHTNLADPDSVKFNFDSLMFKKQYLERVVAAPIEISG